MQKVELARQVQIPVGLLISHSHRYSWEIQESISSVLIYGLNKLGSLALAGNQFKRMKTEFKTVEKATENHFTIFPQEDMAFHRKKKKKKIV